MTDPDTKELLDRTRRIETRLMSLGSRLGFNLKDEEGITVDAATQTVEVESMDVSVSMVMLVCRRHGLHGKWVRVLFKGEVVIERFKV